MEPSFSHWTIPYKRRRLSDVGTHRTYKYFEALSFFFRLPNSFRRESVIMATPTYKKISRTTGQGTAEDPEVQLSPSITSEQVLISYQLNWTCDAPGGKKGRPSPLRDGCEKLVRQVAVEHGFTHAWIRYGKSRTVMTYRLTQCQVCTPFHHLGDQQRHQG